MFICFLFFAVEGIFHAFVRIPYVNVWQKVDPTTRLICHEVTVVVCYRFDVGPLLLPRLLANCVVKDLG